MAQPRQQPARSLKSIPINEIPGLTAQNQREANDCGLKTAHDLCEAFKTARGDLTRLQESNGGGFPIDRSESNHIGDCLLRWTQCPEDIRKDYVLSNGEEVPAAAAGTTPADAARNGSQKDNAVLAFLKKYW